MTGLRVVAWPPPRPPIKPMDLVAIDPAYRAVYERALAYYRERELGLDS